jgi:hypothetical protein
MDANRDREWTRNKDEPRMNQPSREAMAGELRIYADREPIPEERSPVEVRLVRRSKRGKWAESEAPETI